MKIDLTKVKKCSSEVPFDCKQLIDELKSCNEDQLLNVLKNVKTWSCGKCELYHWVEILDIFDSILEECCSKEHLGQWRLPVDQPGNEKKRDLLLAVISFTSLLIEHSFSRHFYNSIEHLVTLLSSTDMHIVLAILNLLFVFSKRSNFFTRIDQEKRQSLLSRLVYMAENWGGKDQGFGLAQCCQSLPLSSYPPNAVTYNFEFYVPKQSSLNSENSDKISDKTSKTTANLKQQSTSHQMVRIHLENVHQIDKPASELMEGLIEKYQIPETLQMQIFTQLRLTKNFANYQTRLLCVQARLNALSIIVYCQAMSIQDNYYQLLHNGLIEELVEVLELKSPDLIEIKSASLKTLTSIIHLDRSSKLRVIIDSTGANSYHGFLPILVRNCINSLISGQMDEYPLSFVTALFSFLYHLASYDSGCEALVQCGIMESLLRVVDWKGTELDHITFVTRAVRVIDLLTNQVIDINSFQNNNGLNIFVNRLEYEVNICRKEQPYEIEISAELDSHKEDEDTVMNPASCEIGGAPSPMEVEVIESDNNSKKKLTASPTLSLNNVQCYPQRAALLKSMLNFLKKAVQCSSLSEGIRHLMYGSFPRSLRHMISNAEYYGSSLFLLATDVVSVYVYQEPSLLSVIQDNHLTDVILHALLIKDVPPTKEVLASLPTVFTSLCLNHRGLEAFVSLRPFDRLFKIFLSPDYLQAMRRRRSESIGDTATCLGNSMDELMRHQPSLRISVIEAIIKLLNDICHLGSDERYICAAPTKILSLHQGSLSVHKHSTSSPSSGVQSSQSQSNSRQQVSSGSSGGRQNSASSNVSLVFPVVERSSGGSLRVAVVGNDSSSSEDDDDFDDDTATTTTASAVTPVKSQKPIPEDDHQSGMSKTALNRASSSSGVIREPIPLVDYIHNVMRFVDAILSNNSTDDHCQEFIKQKGLEPLFSLLGLPNLPVDFPVSPACYSVASVFKSLLNLAHEKDIFVKGLSKLEELLVLLQDFCSPPTTASPVQGSILLEDLIQQIQNRKSSLNLGSNNAMLFQTNLVQAMSAIHAYIVVFIHICRTGQGDIRSISIDQWGSPLGIDIITKLGKLYVALVWESTLLLGFGESTLPKYDFVKSQVDRLNQILKSSGSTSSSTCSSSMVTNENELKLFDLPGGSPMEIDLDTGDLNSICSNCGWNRTDDQAQPIKSSKSMKQSQSGSSSSSQATKMMQQRFIKPLLTVASRLGRALAELFGLLVKLCVGSPIRRRSHHNQFYMFPSQYTVPSKTSQNISKHLNVLLREGLSWKPPPEYTVPKFRLTFYVCSIGFSSPMLFDDRKYPYHLMLQQFVLENGQDEFFQSFHAAFEEVSAKANDEELPDGIIEFLDSWLLLLEKMTNPQTLLDSPYGSSSTIKHTDSNQTQDYVPFNPMQYLMRTHKKAFPCIMDIWNCKIFKIKSDRVIESLLTIFSHILKGEKLIEKYLEKPDRDPSVSTTGPDTVADVDNLVLSTSSSAAATVRQSLENSPHLPFLIDMGFSREMAIDALFRFGNLVQATEWLLEQQVMRSIDVDNEDEDMMRAIAMSIANTEQSEVTVATTEPAQQDSQQKGLKKPGQSSIVPAPSVSKSKIQPMINEQPLRKDEINSFTNDILSGTLKLIDQLPSIVHKCCELLISILKRNGRQWLDGLLQQLIEEICNQINGLESSLYQTASPSSIMIIDQDHSTQKLETNDSKCQQSLHSCPQALRLSARLHLLTLLFNETKNHCAKQIAENGVLLDRLIDFLETSAYKMNISNAKDPSVLGGLVETPKWLAPLLLLLDLYDKNALASRRRRQLLLQTANCRRTWKYYDDRSSRWASYGSPQNKLIDDAFRSGEQQCRFSLQRRRYTIFFNSMMQVNDETGNYRPIMFVIEQQTSQTAKDASKKETQNKKESKKEAENVESVSDLSEEPSKKKKEEVSNVEEQPQVQANDEACALEIAEVNFFTDYQTRSILESMINLMQFPLDPDTLNAVMRLTLRLTKNYQYAQLFVERNGISTLLRMPTQSLFPGFVSLTTLIIRHVLEDEQTIRMAMDRIIRQQANNSINMNREMHYLFRYFSPAACRDLEIFKQSSMSLLRINLNIMMSIPGRRVLSHDDDRAVTYLKSAPAKLNDQPENVNLMEQMPKTSKDIVAELLNMLPIKFHAQQQQSSNRSQSTNSNNAQQQQQKMEIDSSPGSSSILDPNITTTGNTLNSSVTNSSRDKDTCFYTFTILSILAELTRSYNIVAKIICEHVYPLGFINSIMEDCSAISFILDNLLSNYQTYGDKDCATYSRALFASMATVTFSIDVHQTLVTEIKNALQRAVVLPESVEKHAKIQSLSALITNIIESYPQISRAPISSLSLSSNSIIKLLIRKGLVQDLAKVIQSLDLSSPMMSATVNSLLRTLEYISKNVNNPNSAYPPGLPSSSTNGSAIASNNQQRNQINSSNTQVLGNNNIRSNRRIGNNTLNPSSNTSNSTTQPNETRQLMNVVESLMSLRSGSGGNSGSDSMMEQDIDPSSSSASNLHTTANNVLSSVDSSLMLQAPTTINDTTNSIQHGANNSVSSALATPLIANISNTDTMTTTTHSSQATNAIREEEISNLNSNISNTLDNSNIIDENTENELFLDSATFDLNSHPRSGTFTSDELRTDDDDEDNPMVDSADHHRHHRHHIETGGSANQNLMESSDSETESEEEDDDSEEDEEEEDDAGSAQDDEHEDDEDEEEEEDEHMDDDDDDELVDNDLGLNALLDDTIRYDSDVIFNLEEVLPQVLSVRERIPPSAFLFDHYHDHHDHHSLLNHVGNHSQTSSGVGGSSSNNPGVGGLASLSIQTQHPLLTAGSSISNNVVSSTPANADQTSSTISAPFGATISFANSGSGAVVQSSLPTFSSSRAPRTLRRSLRHYLGGGGGGHNNWQVAHFNTRSNPSQILQRLLGSASPDTGFLSSSFVRAGTLIGTGANSNQINSSGMFGNRSDLVDIREDLYDSPTTVTSPFGGYNAFSNQSLNVIPSTMSRWYEESRLLDAEYMHDAITLVKTEIIRHLEKLKEEELVEKKRKEKEEIEANKKQDTKSKSEKVVSENSSTTVTNETESQQPTNPTDQQAPANVPASLDHELQAHIEQLTSSVINQVFETHLNPNGSASSPSINHPSITAPVSTSNSSQSQPQSMDNLTVLALAASSAESQANTNQLVANMDRMEIVPAPSEEPMTISSDSQAIVNQLQPSIPQSENQMIALNEAENNSNSFTTPFRPIMMNVVELMDDGSNDNQNNLNEQQHVEVNVWLDPLEDQPQQPQETSELQESDVLSTPTLIDEAVSSQRQLTEEEQAILGDQELPEGVDPSFLAALPENIRQEVIADQLRMQRLRQTQINQGNSSSIATIPGPSSSSSSAAFAEVSPEFLAALPPNIQEEVLAQQRAEQQRLNAQNSNPDAPVDPDSFFRSLPPSLRRQVLSDLDDSQVRLLPPDIANEARTLRQEYELRHREFQERLFSSSNALTRIIRSAANARARIEGINIPNQWTFTRLSVRGGAGNGGSHSRQGNNDQYSVRFPRVTYRTFKGKHLLDFDGLANILILLFIHDNVISSVRLHRVIKNLCYHGPTRQWVIQALLEILEKTKESVSNTFDQLEQDDPIMKSLVNNHTVSWLSITLDSSFGSKTNVFYLSKTPNLPAGNSFSSKKPSSSLSSSNQAHTIYIHPQATMFVCRNVLEILISLAKAFPEQFISTTISVGASSNNGEKLQRNVSTSSLSASNSSMKEVSNTLNLPSQDALQSSSQTTVSVSKPPPSFFDVLMRHEFINVNKKSRSKQGTTSASNFSISNVGDNSNNSTLNQSKMNSDLSPFSRLMCFLSLPFMKKSTILIDRLVRLMTHITVALSNDYAAETRAHAVPSSSNSSTSLVNTTNTAQQARINEHKERLSEIEKTVANERLLKLLVDILISKCCSEEGLLDVSSLLIKLSNVFVNCRQIFYNLLLKGVQDLGHVVYKDINLLYQEMSDFLAKEQSTPSTNSQTGTQINDQKQSSSGPNPLQSVQDRYSSFAIVINAQTQRQTISGREVQLPSMSNLISKSSSQLLFLRILKIIIHIRDIIVQKNKTETSKNRKSENKSNESQQNQDDKEIMDVEDSITSNLEKLSQELDLDVLWEKLSDCLLLLSEAQDNHVVLVLQPVVEAFFLVHAPERSQPPNEARVESITQQSEHINQSTETGLMSPQQSITQASSDQQALLEQEQTSKQYTNMPEDAQKFLSFAEKHRIVLNQILRQSNVHLANGPFAVLVDHTRILDFDVKRRYFRQELERLDQGARRDDLPVHIRREHVFEDSYRELNRRGPEEWKNRFYIVFEGEEGQDAGGLLREWYTIISREIFNPMYALFTTSPGDRVTYMINSASHCNSNHLSYFKFVGRVIAKAIYDNKLLDCYFTRSFYKHILGKLVKYTDMESEDYAFYQGLVFLLEHNVSELGTELTFSLEIQEFGVTEVRDLIPNGREVFVTERTKQEYVKLVCQEKMTGSIKKQLNSFLEGFYEIIPKRLISIFNEHELELLISGLPTIDIDDLKANTEYHKYQVQSLQIQWFWRALRTFDQADMAKFLQFVTGTSKVPLQGFSALEGMNGPQKFQIHLDDRSTDRLPSAHTCFNQLDLPAYETYDKLRMMLLKAIRECSEGFGFA